MTVGVCLVCGHLVVVVGGLADRHPGRTGSCDGEGKPPRGGRGL